MNDVGASASAGSSSGLDAFALSCDVRLVSKVAPAASRFSMPLILPSWKRRRVDVHLLRTSSLPRPGRLKSVDCSYAPQACLHRSSGVGSAPNWPLYSTSPAHMTRVM